MLHATIMPRLVSWSKAPWKLFFIIAVSLLTGCAGQVNMLPALANDTQLQVNQGIVVVRVINASGYPLPFNQLTLTPENINASKQIKPERMLAQYPMTDSSTVFASPVNAGSYALSSIRAFYSNGEYWYSRFISTDARFGTFEVQPGKVTDLGTLVYYPKSQDDKYIDTLLRIPEVQPGEVLDKYFSFYSYDSNELLSWRQDDYNDERETNFLSAAQNPVIYTKRYLAPDNSVYFLGKLGIIIKRTAEGEWELDAVDTNLDLSAIAQNDRGDLVVGGGEGKVFWKPLGGDWRDISLDYQYNIETLNLKGDRLDMLARESTKLSIFRRNMGGADNDWQEMDSYTSVKGWKSIPPPPAKENKTVTKKPKHPRKIASATLSNVGNKHLLTLKTYSARQSPVFASMRTEYFAYEPGSWKITPLKESPEISYITNAGAVTLGIKNAGFWSMSSQPTYLRLTPGSSNWEEISTFARKCNGEITDNPNCVKGKTTVPSKKFSFQFKSIPWFKNENEAVAFVSFSHFDFWTSKHTYETKMLSTNDGGRTWIELKHEPPKPYCASIIPEIKDRLLVSCNGASGDFFESIDDGATWEHVRQHENI